MQTVENWYVIIDGEGDNTKILMTHRGTHETAWNIANKIIEHDTVKEDTRYIDVYGGWENEWGMIEWIRNN